MHLSEIRVSYHPRLRNSERPLVKTSGDAYALFLDHWNKDTLQLQESFKLLFLNRAGRALGLYELSKGGTGTAVVDPRLVFAVALKTVAASLLLCHNHPSGTLSPSEQDLTITRKLREGGRLLDIAVMDHLILNEEGYYSFADEGLL